MLKLNKLGSIKGSNENVVNFKSFQSLEKSQNIPQLIVPTNIAQFN